MPRRWTWLRNWIVSLYFHFQRRRFAFREAYLLPYARRIKQAVRDTPVIAEGGFRSPQAMEGALLQGVDLVALSRPLIREPDLPARWQGGDRTPAACVSCSGCFGPARRGEGIRCVDAE